MGRRTLAVVVLAVLAACGGGSGTGPPGTPTSPTSPTSPAPPSPSPSPTPAPPPSPATYTLSGTVTEAGTSNRASGARVQVIEGANDGKTATTDAEGHYQLDELDAGTFTLRASAEGFEAETRSVTLTANYVLDIGLRRVPSRPAGTLAGTVVDGVTDRTLSGVTVRIEGVGEAITSGDGAFTINTDDPAEQVKPVRVTSGVTIERQTHLRVPGAAVRLPLMPVSADLAAFDQMFRNGGVLRRWTTAPAVVIQTRTLRFTSTADTEFTAASATMSEADVSGIVADLTWALPQLTGHAFNAFSQVSVETADEGARVPVTRLGAILIARYEGLTAATTYWGYTRWAWNGAGELQAAALMLDDGFDTSASVYRRSLRSHELGHALGYAHVTARDSVMNANGRTEPNDFDRNGAKLAFLRPPLNRSPDIDPDPFIVNLRTGRELTWHPGMR